MRMKFDRSLWLVILLAAVVVIPRSAMVSLAHSETWDEQYHLLRGLRILERSDLPIFYNDAPLGEMIIALPLWAIGATRAVPTAAEVGSDGGVEAASFAAVFYDQKYSPETLKLIVAVWKAVLYLPFVGLVFVWGRRLYGERSAWLAAAVFVVEPTFAAHVGIAALDVLSVEAILAACYLAWRYFERPTAGRLIAAGVAVAVGMLVKHTGIILPGVVGLMAVAWWVRTRREVGLRERLIGAAGVGLVAVVAIWPLTLFDVSQPRAVAHSLPVKYDEAGGFNLALEINDRLVREMPAGVYVGSIAEAWHHKGEGHPGFLLGEQRMKGWWYYYPVVAAYKVPIGIAVIGVLAVVVAWRRVPLRFDELALGIPFVCFSLWLSSAGINIGFRHVMAPYAMLLLLVTRAVAGPVERWRDVIAWVAVAGTWVHSAVAYHPDYIAYMNWPRHKAHNQISDSNVDWGQSLKQVRRWLDANPAGGRPIYLGYWGRVMPQTMPHYLGAHPVRILGDLDPPPKSGILIISPIWEAGVGDPGDIYGFLRPHEPVAVIGHSMLVYDLDRIFGGRAATTAATTRGAE